MNKKNILRNPGLQTLIASLLCILIGILIGYIVLLVINAEGAGAAIAAILKNFLTYPTKEMAMQYFGSTLVKSVPLLMCSLSILFAYKVGLFNIGASGQYTAGACVALFLALKCHAPWYVCTLAALIAGVLMGAIAGALKAYLNVNEVIACIMLNWIMLYTTNTVLSGVKDSSNYTMPLKGSYTIALLPSLGLGKLFSDNKYVTMALPLSVILAILVWVVLEKTKLGYELKATGFNKHAAKYSGMREKKNTILTMGIAGGLAGLGAAFYYLTGIEQWACSQTSVPGMGFNGIAAAFLGGLSPIGCIFSSFFIQHITSGGSYVDKSVFCSQISDLITAIIIYLCGFVLIFRVLLNRFLDIQEEKKKAKTPITDEKGGEQ